MTRRIEPDLPTNHKCPAHAWEFASGQQQIAAVQNGGMDHDTNPEEPAAVEVFWRPGCPYCDRLLRRFDAAAVVYRLHNIWEDDSAKRFVKQHNHGNETVPTVALDGEVVTNPDPAAFIDDLRLRHPALLRQEKS